MSTSIGTVCVECVGITQHLSVSSQSHLYQLGQMGLCLLVYVLPRLEYKPESSEDSYCN